MTPPNGTGPPRPTRPSRGSRPPGEPTERPGLPAQGERGQRAPGPALVGSSRRPVHVPASAGAGRDQLAGRAGDSLRRHPAQGLGRQQNLGRGASTVRADVGLEDVLAAGTFGPRLPQSTPSWHAGGAALTPPDPRREASCADQWPRPIQTGAGQPPRLTSRYSGPVSPLRVWYHQHLLGGAGPAELGCSSATGGIT